MTEMFNCKDINLKAFYIQYSVLFRYAYITVLLGPR